MSVEDHFVINPPDFESLRVRAANVFNPNTHLPDQVFQNGFRSFRFLEFELMYFPEFWKVLAACAKQCGDSDISLLLHDPDPKDYYFSNFHRFGALRFSPNDRADDYIEALNCAPEGSPFSLSIIAETMSFCGSSMKWGFWGERAYGWVVACIDPNMVWPSIEGINWFSLDDAMANLIAPNCRTGLIPKEFAEAMKGNYPTPQLRRKYVTLKSLDETPMYLKVIDQVMRYATSCSLTVRQDLPFSDEGRLFLQRAASDLIQSEDTTGWPGTTLVAGKAKVYKFRLSSNFQRLFLSSGTTLKSWKQPWLPEDPAFYRQDGSVLLGSVSQYGNAFLELKDEPLMEFEGFFGTVIEAQEDQLK